MADLPTIESLWQEYASRVRVPMGGLQWKETRRAFYAASVALLQAQRDQVPENEEAGVEWLQSMLDECARFFERVREGKA